MELFNKIKIIIVKKLNLLHQKVNQSDFLNCKKMKFKLNKKIKRKPRLSSKNKKE